MDFPSFVGRPLSSTATSLECFLVEMNSDIPMIYLKLLFSLVIPITLILVYTLGRTFTYVITLKAKSFPWHNIITAIIFLIIYMQPDLVTYLISLLSCR